LLRNKIFKEKTNFNFFIKKYVYKFKKNIEGISEEGIQMLENYDWPGNIRQLENIIERLVARTKKSLITTNLIKEIMKLQYEGGIIDNYQKQDNLNYTLSGNLEDIEKTIIKRVIQEEKGNKAAVVRRLGISRTTLWRKLNNK
jgi:transcriptional regulator with PAS, ATPase and Fis domain